MCKFLKTILAVVLIAGLVCPAYAGWNLRQKSDGGTYWQEIGPRGVTEYHVLRTYLTAHLSDVGRQATAFVVSPIAGFVEKIYTTFEAAFGSTATITWQFWISDTLTSFRALSQSQEITNGTTRHTGGVYSVAGGTSAFTPRANGNAWSNSQSGTWANENFVKEGGIISIQSAGETSPPQSGLLPANVIVVINPQGR